MDEEIKKKYIPLPWVNELRGLRKSIDNHEIGYDDAFLIIYHYGLSEEKDFNKRLK